MVVRHMPVAAVPIACTYESARGEKWVESGKRIFKFA